MMADNPSIAEAEMNVSRPYDASDPEQVNAARKKAGRQKKTRLEVIQALMSLPAGRQWVYEKLTDCHVYGPTFVAGDPYLSAFREGERHVGLGLLQDVMASAPERFLPMCKEAQGES